jgi:hypothetical protein
LSYARNPTPPAGIGTNRDGFSNVAKNANTANLDPQFSSKAQAFQQAAKAAGVDTTLLSGYRDVDLQSRLYANYQAKQAGQPIPYPQDGSGGIAAKPGQSYHNYGRAIDLAANTPQGQQWLIANAPKYGLYPGANFGDPPHFQDADWSPNSGQPMHQGTETSESGQSTPGSVAQPFVAQHPVAANIGPASAVPSMAYGPDGSSAPASIAAMPGTAANPNAFKLAMLLSMFPQHKFTPIDYNPYATEPRMRAPGATLD